jgi:hypothetical protein
MYLLPFYGKKKNMPFIGANARFGHIGCPAGRHNLKQILTFLEELVHFPRVVDSTQNLLKSHVHCNLPTGRIEMPNAMFGTSIQKVSSSPQKVQIFSKCQRASN